MCEIHRSGTNNLRISTDVPSVTNSRLDLSMETMGTYRLRKIRNPKNPEILPNTNIGPQPAIGAGSTSPYPSERDTPANRK